MMGEFDVVYLPDPGCFAIVVTNMAYSKRLVYFEEGEKFEIDIEAEDIYDIRI
jgi:hypothetical protein